ncbi:hypothetical protein FRC03_004843 [Tulasnella sp. 419]|nr:hypothetical protein FRC03_004843 [Tulasnella sp. 419]
MQQPAPRDVCRPSDHNIRGHRSKVLKLFRTGPARQRMMPITLRQEADTQFPYNLHNHPFEQINIIMDVSTTSWCRFIADPRNTPFSDPIFDVYIQDLRHNHVNTVWFRHLAVGLAETRLKVGLMLPAWLHPHIVHPRGVHAHLNLSALTATALQMRLQVTDNPHNQENQQLQEAFLRIVSLNPGVVARDFRVYGMGGVVGTNAIRCLLAAIFVELLRMGYRPSEQSLVLAYAAADLLVAHLAQGDQHRMIRHGPRAEVYTALGALMPIMVPPGIQFRGYARIASFRDGIIFGAMRAYAKDIDSHNESHVEILNNMGASFSEGVINAAGAVGHLAAAAARTAFTALKSPFSHAIKNRWIPDQLDRQILGLFNIQIRDGAADGYIKGWNHNIPALDQPIANQYVDTAERIMNGIATQVSPLTRGAYW